MLLCEFVYIYSSFIFETLRGQIKKWLNHPIDLEEFRVSPLSYLGYHLLRGTLIVPRTHLPNLEETSFQNSLGHYQKEIKFYPLFLIRT